MAENLQGTGDAVMVIFSLLDIFLLILFFFFFIAYYYLLMCLDKRIYESITSMSYTMK